jgi:hypothetical protein
MSDIPELKKILLVHGWTPSGWRGERQSTIPKVESANGALPPAGLSVTSGRDDVMNTTTAQLPEPQLVKWSAELQELTVTLKQLHDGMMTAVDGAFQGAEGAVEGVRHLLVSWHQGVKPSHHEFSCAHAACVDFLGVVRQARVEVAKELDRVKRTL